MPEDGEIELEDSGFYCAVIFGWAQIGFCYAQVKTNPHSS